MIPDAVARVYSDRAVQGRRRGPVVPSAAALILALAAAFHAVPGAVAQQPGSLRAELAGQTSLQDFPARLAAAADRASGLTELLALLEEFLPKVKEGPERRALFLRWAAVLELAGRWEEAAARYEEAAFAAPGQRDTESLLWAARAWLAAGETEKALSILRVLGAASPEAAVRTRSTVLEGWARLIEGSAAEARTLAARAAASPPDRETLLSALTLLWAASEGPSRGEAAARIRREFPGTPEAVMVESGAVPPASHWLLTPAGGGARPSEAPAPGSPAAAPPAATGSAPAKVLPPAPASSPAAASDPGPAAVRHSDSSRIASFQTGAFSEERNADALVKELSGKGFAAVVERRERGGKPLWVVLVPAGADSQATLLRLKDAGYEAYPVF
ncbi:MAG TPA: SPOR domain-containing protein [Spirochaetia bacterium]|nr:SPOR domain-containing protein [Spirochaetales bacterium]HRY81511.1 SPOR domain-containing protein [Spirochaetia bacterium]